MISKADVIPMKFDEWWDVRWRCDQFIEALKAMESKKKKLKERKEKTAWIKRRDRERAFVEKTKKKEREKERERKTCIMHWFLGYISVGVFHDHSLKV